MLHIAVQRTIDQCDLVMRHEVLFNFKSFFRFFSSCIAINSIHERKRTYPSLDIIHVAFEVIRAQASINLNGTSCGMKNIDKVITWFYCDTFFYIFYITLNAKYTNIWILI